MNSLVVSADKSRGLLNRLRNFFTSRPQRNEARGQSVGLIHLSRRLRLNNEQQQDLAECIEQLRQHRTTPDSMPARSQVFDDSNEALQRVNHTLTRFNDWVATLDDSQWQQFRHFLQQRRGAA